MHKLNSTSLDHQFRSRWCLRALKCLYMRSTPSLRSFSNAVFETVPVSMGDDGPHLSFQGRSSSNSSFHASLLLATDGVMPLALCPQVLSTATCDGCFTRLSTCCHFPSQRHVQGSTPASLPAQSFPFTAACPAQHACQSTCSVISLHSSMSSAAHLPVYLLSHFPSQQHVQCSTPASLPAQSFPFTAACPVQHTCQSTCSVISLHSSMSSAAHLPVYLLSHFPSQQHVQCSTPASLPAQSFPFTAACPAQHTRRSFQRGMLTTDTFQPGLPVPLFITSSLNLWGWWHVVWLTLLEENQWRAWVTAYTFTVKLHNSKKHLIFIPMMPTSSSCANQFKSYRQLKLTAIKSPTVRNWPVEIWSHTTVRS